MKQPTKMVRMSFAALPLTFVFGCGAEGDRILMKRHAGNNYCHMKVETRGDPNKPGEREVVDYYGPCDERPTARR